MIKYNYTRESKWCNDVCLNFWKLFKFPDEEERRSCPKTGPYDWRQRQVVRHGLDLPQDFVSEDQGCSLLHFEGRVVDGIARFGGMKVFFKLFEIWLCHAIFSFKVQNIISVDPCHKFTWCLDACIREKNVDIKRSRELQGFLDSIRVMTQNILFKESYRILE